MFPFSSSQRLFGLCAGSEVPGTGAAAQGAAGH